MPRKVKVISDSLEKELVSYGFRFKM